MRFSVKAVLSVGTPNAAYFLSISMMADKESRQKNAVPIYDYKYQRLNKDRYFYLKDILTISSLMYAISRSLC